MIKFGTSGWRGIIGEDFTFGAVRVASQGIANYLKSSGQKGSGMVVAFDTRFLSEKFASEAAKIFAYNGIQAFLCNRDVPTPCVSFETVRRKAMGAINFTASHNPPEYNGLKFSTSNGAPALPEITKQIEREIHTLEERNQLIDVYEKPELIETIDPKDRYLTELRNKVDVDAISKSGLRIAIDSLYGTSRDYLDYFLLDAGVEVKTSTTSATRTSADSRRSAARRTWSICAAWSPASTTTSASRRTATPIARHRRRPQPLHVAERDPGAAGALPEALSQHSGRPRAIGRDDAPHRRDREETRCAAVRDTSRFKYIGELILEDKIALAAKRAPACRCTSICRRRTASSPASWSPRWWRAPARSCISWWRRCTPSSATSTRSAPT